MHCKFHILTFNAQWIFSALSYLTVGCVSVIKKRWGDICLKTYKGKGSSNKTEVSIIYRDALKWVKGTKGSRWLCKNFYIINNKK